MIYIASDHGGYNLKKHLLDYFKKNNIEHEDLGSYELIPEDDYTDYALKLVERVRSNENSAGILLCRNGVGVNILSNKFKGIRAALSFDPQHAISSKNDDNSNVLCLPADYINEQKAIDTVTAWLNTPFSNFDRHNRRLNNIAMYGQE